jgi:hypothetical protein
VTTYRSDDGASTSFTRVADPLPEPSANAHRIHYDEPCTTATAVFVGDPLEVQGRPERQR